MQRRRREPTPGRAAGSTTHAALLDAGEKLFSHKGFESTTVLDLAAAAGVNVSLISYHFGGKIGLYRACLERFGSARLTAVQKILQPCADFSEFSMRFKIFTGEFIESHLENQDRVTMIQREIQNGLRHAPDTFQKTFLRMFETLVEFLTDAQKKKIIRSDAIPFVMASTFYGSVIHALTNDHVRQKFYKTTLADPAHQREFIDQIMIAFVDGLHPDSAISRRS
jgi:AcrR family transcriptional regulator